MVLCVLFKCRKHVDEEETAAGCIHLLMKHRTQTATTQLCCGCLCFVSLPRGALSVITAFPGHTHLLLWMFSFFLQALQLSGENMQTFPLMKALGRFDILISILLLLASVPYFGKSYIFSDIRSAFVYCCYYQPF